MMYCAGLGLRVLGGFKDHQGFDGVMLGNPGAQYHFEFTRCRLHPVVPLSTEEDLLVLYVPDTAEWDLACGRMLTAKFRSVTSLNPYWDINGRTFADADGYRTVLQNTAWLNQEAAP